MPFSRRLAGLFVALVFLVSVPAQAQVNAGPLPLTSTPVPLITPASGTASVTISASGNLDSVVFVNPQEIQSIDYDAATGSFDGPVMTFTFSDSASGPFAAAVDTLSSGYTLSVTFSNTPTSGANVKLPPFKYAKANLAATSTGAIPIKRVTGLRRRYSADNPRPVIFNDTLVEFDGLDNTVLTNNTSSAAQASASGDPFVNAGEMLGFFLITSGSGTKKVQMRYSNSKSGPFVVWEDQGSAGNQNEVSTTAASASINMRPFNALYWKLIERNEAGASRTTTRLNGFRRSQRIQ